MSNTNKGLTTASKRKKDEFYTLLPDIERELSHYRQYFCDKTILCNCDDPYESNFFKYFALNFTSLGLKKLICTGYESSPIMYTQLNLFGEEEVVGMVDTKTPYKAVLTSVSDLNGDNRQDIDDVALALRETPPERLKGNGDFRSEECIEILKEADIVITNPPFSLFKEYVSQLIQYDKKFLIIGNQNAITYREIFPLFMQNKIWLGYGFKRNCAHFFSPYEDTASDTDHREGLIRVSGIMWYTNLDVKKRHEEIILYEHYSPDKYPKYDNYDAIEVSRSELIPCDYDGVMGVPITFMTKYNPDQFELIGASESEGKGSSNGLWTGGPAQPVVNGKRTYKRLFIRKNG